MKTIHGKSNTFSSKNEPITAKSFSLVDQVEEKSTLIEEVTTIEPVETQNHSVSHLCGIYFHSMLTVCLILLLICSYY